MKTNQEFTIESMPNNTFRITKLSPMEVLALSSVVDFEKFEQNLTLFNFAVEHTEVLIGNDWIPVKRTDAKGNEYYMPIGVDKNFKALRDLVFYFTKEVLGEVFQNSGE